MDLAFLSAIFTTLLLALRLAVIMAFSYVPDLLLEDGKSAAILMKMPRQSPKLVSLSITLLIKSRLKGLRAKAIYGTTLMENEVSGIIYSDFSQKALAERRTSPHQSVWADNSLDTVWNAGFRDRSLMFRPRVRYRFMS